MSDGFLQSSFGLETYSESDTTNSTRSGPKSYDGSSMDIVADYFFSSRTGEKSRSQRWMLQALLYQILAQNPKLFGSFRESFQDVRSSKTTWRYNVLKKVFMNLCSQASQQRIFVAPRFYLVIDAFDESENLGNIERSDVLDMFSALCRASNTSTRPACILKILLVSRPASDIENRLRGFSSIEMHKQTALDIEEIVNSGLDSIVQSLKDSTSRSTDKRNSDGDNVGEDRNRSLVSKQLEETNITDLYFAKDYILQHANGIILWVVLIIKELRSLFLDGFWTLIEIKQMLSSLPRDLEQCYEEMIRRIMKGAERDSQRGKYAIEQRLTKTQMMLSWATFAVRPLTLEEFREIIAIGDIESQIATEKTERNNMPPLSSTTLLTEHRFHNEKQVHRAVIHFCSGLLETMDGVRFVHTQSHRYVSATDVVQLLHRSAKDFLLYNKRAGRFQMQLRHSSSAVCLLSIKYLQLSLPVEHLLTNPQDWFTADYKRFIDHLKDRPLLSYILFALPKHLQAAGSSHLRDEFTRYLGRLQSDSDSYAWKFLEFWVHQHAFMLPAHQLSVRAASFRMQCALTAAELGESGVVKLIIEAGITDLSSTLLAASKCGDLATVRAVLDQGQKQSLTTCRAAFFTSVKHGHLSIINLLITSGRIQADVRMERQVNAMHIAAAEGHLRVLTYLIEAGSDIEAEDESGTRPLHVAALTGKLDAVKLLVSRGASLQQHTKVISGYEHTALTFAAMSGHLDVVAFIVGKYEYLDDMDVTGGFGMIRDDGPQAIELAKSKRHNEICKVLENALNRVQQRSFSLFKLEDHKVVASRAAAAAANGVAAGKSSADRNTREAQAEEVTAGEQNKIIERLIGGNLSSRESIHLLSLAQRSNEQSRETQRYSRVYLKPEAERQSI
jgi:hypothetical protein